jgi:hypothetical protein
MPPQIIAAIIGVSSVILGTFIGGFIAYLSNKNIKLKEWQLSLIKEEINGCKKLYSDFLGEVNRIVLFALEEKASSVRKLDLLINYYSQIELVATDKVIERAKALVNYALDCNSQSTNKRDQNFDHLKKNFIEAVKNDLFELKSINNSLQLDMRKPTI